MAGLENLDSLILAHNIITTVPGNVFSHLTLLNSLELEGNKIINIDKDAFKGLEGFYRDNLTTTTKNCEDKSLKKFLST